MASSSAPVHPGRYLSVFLVLLIGAYLLVFLTGDKQADPKLGIDLQGGTRVTLTARTPDGSTPRAERRWRRRSRSSALESTGWASPVRRSSSTATTWSSRCPETTATRPATWDRPRGSTSVRSSTRFRRRPPNRSPRPAAPGARARAQRSTGARAQRSTGAGADRADRRPRPVGKPGTAATAVPAGPDAGTQPGTRPGTRARAAGTTPAPATGAPAPTDVPSGDQPAPPDPRKDLAERIATEKKWRQSTRQGVQYLALQFQATLCDKGKDILAGNDDPACRW